jgi:hypothetical protein
VAVDPFAEAEVRYKFLVEERRTGTLLPRAFRLAVRDLAVLDSEGRRWMLGPEDGIWYRRENERWLQADPPRRLVCPSCGHHNLGRHSFCVECGHRLNRERRSAVRLRLPDPVDQSADEGNQGGQEPQPPPHRPPVPAHHLVAAEAAVTVKWPSDSAAAAALVQLEPAVATPRLLGMVEHHRRLIAAWTKARGDKG